MQHTEVFKGCKLIFVYGFCLTFAQCIDCGGSKESHTDCNVTYICLNYNEKLYDNEKSSVLVADHGVVSRSQSWCVKVGYEAGKIQITLITASFGNNVFFYHICMWVF